MAYKVIVIEPQGEVHPQNLRLSQKHDRLKIINADSTRVLSFAPVVNGGPPLFAEERFTVPAGGVVISGPVNAACNAGDAYTFESESLPVSLASSAAVGGSSPSSGTTPSTGQVSALAGDIIIDP